MRFQLAVAALLVGCAPAAAPRQAVPPPCPVCPAPPPTLTAIASAELPAPAKPDPPPPGFNDSMAAAMKALNAGDFAATEKGLLAAKNIGGTDVHLRYVVVRALATLFATTGDFEKAASALVESIPLLATRPDLSDEFWAHNAMMMIRVAQGDPAAALAENDQATIAAARGTWDPEHRRTLAFQKDRWHRAYLTRMLAESRTASAKQGLMQYATAALEDYRPTGYPDSIAILDAYFAALDGKRDAALAAARKVDPTKNDDLEDLYLVVVGLEAGGDHKGADAVRAVMRRPSNVYFSRSIMLRWLDLDANPPSAKGFTPWHARTR